MDSLDFSYYIYVSDSLKEDYNVVWRVIFPILNFECILGLMQTKLTNT